MRSKFPPPSRPTDAVCSVPPECTQRHPSAAGSSHRETSKSLSHRSHAASARFSQTHKDPPTHLPPPPAAPLSSSPPRLAAPSGKTGSPPPPSHSSPEKLIPSSSLADPEETAAAQPAEET